MAELRCELRLTLGAYFTFKVSTMKDQTIITLIISSLLGAFAAVVNAQTNQDDAATIPRSSASTMAERMAEIRGTGTELRQLSLNVYGTRLQSAVFNNYGMVLPKGGFVSFKQTFTIPLDYQNGTPLGVRMLWHMGGSGGGNCFVEMWGDFIRIAHPGTNVSSENFQFSNGNSWMPLFAPTSQWEVVETIVWIPGKTGGTGQDIRAGSSIVFGLFREDNINDTCPGDMTIAGLSIVYQVASDGVFRDRFQALP